MVPVIAPRFHLTECKSEQERQFVEALHARATTGGWYAGSWPRDDRLMLAVCLSDRDPKYNCILRTLRVDYDGQSVWFGPDETHQFATDLDPTLPNVWMRSGQHVAELAAAAADWLEQEMRRPIVRYEWDRGGAPRLWVLADTGERLVARCRQSPDIGPPDRIVPVTG